VAVTQLARIGYDTWWDICTAAWRPGAPPGFPSASYGRRIGGAVPGLLSGAAEHVLDVRHRPNGTPATFRTASTCSSRPAFSHGRDPTDRDVWTICATGHRAALATSLLAREQIPVRLWRNGGCRLLGTAHTRQAFLTGPRRSDLIGPSSGTGPPNRSAVTALPGTRAPRRRCPARFERTGPRRPAPAGRGPSQTCRPQPFSRCCGTTSMAISARSAQSRPITTSARPAIRIATQIGAVRRDRSSLGGREAIAGTSTAGPRFWMAPARHHQISMPASVPGAPPATPGNRRPSARPRLRIEAREHFVGIEVRRDHVVRGERDHGVAAPRGGSDELDAAVRGGNRPAAAACSRRPEDLHRSSSGTLTGTACGSLDPRGFPHRIPKRSSPIARPTSDGQRQPSALRRHRVFGIHPP